MATIHDDFVMARPLPPNGYTVTLASRIVEILQIIEERYGPRDRSFTFFGVEFCDDGPQTWFPNNCTNIVIQLSTSAMNDPVRAYYQLAHECVHLLDPGYFGTSNILEEGLATLFALDYARRFQPDYVPASPKYNTAYLLVQRLVSQYPQIIHQLRNEGIRLREIEQTKLQAACPGIDIPFSIVLCTNFENWDGSI